MADLIGAIEPFITIPVMIFMGWTIYSIWSKQEKLYQQQIKSLEAQVDQPSELKASVEIMMQLSEERVKAAEAESEALRKTLEEQGKANLESLQSINLALDEQSWAHVQVLRHDARAIGHVIAVELKRLESILKQPVPDATLIRTSGVRAVEGALASIERLEVVLDQQKVAQANASKP